MPGSRSLGIALLCIDSWCDSTWRSILTGHQCSLKEEVGGVAKGQPPPSSASGGHLTSLSCSSGVSWSLQHTHTLYSSLEDT